MQYDGSGVDLHRVPGEVGVVGSVSAKTREAKKGRRMRNIDIVGRELQSLEAMLV